MPQNQVTLRGPGMNKNKMPTAVFLYTTPHWAHAALASHLNAKFIKNTRKGILKFPFIGKLMQAFIVQKKIPTCEIILCEGSSTDLFAGAIYKKLHPETKLIGIISDPKVPFMNSMPFFDRWTIKWSLKKADLLLPSSKMMLEFIPREMQSKAKIFTPGFESPIFLKQKPALEKKNLSFVGLLSKHKGIDILVDYFDKIKHFFPETSLYIIGDGELLNLKKRNIGRVHFLGRKNPPVIQHAKLSSVYISLARFEPAGTAIVEAMCMGLIPIVSNGVGHKEIVKKLSPRLIVNSPEELQRALEFIWGDEKRLKELSKKAKQIGSKYTVKNMFGEFDAGLKTILKKD